MNCYNQFRVMKVVTLTKRFLEIQPYVVQMINGISVKEEPVIDWRFTKKESAQKAAEDLSKRENATLYVASNI